MLTSFPICLEWLDYDATSSYKVNYMAVGTLNPWIEIWDLDLIDNLQPEFILGSSKTIKKKKLKTDSDSAPKKTKLKGHSDAILDLSWNHLNKNLLASGSVDKSIILWNLDTLKQVTKIKNHSDKVQSLKFHPIEAFSLLSGSADKTVVLYDCRNPKLNKKEWQIKNACEQIIWNPLSPNEFAVSDDNGAIYYYDIRTNEPLMYLEGAHDLEETGSTTMALSFNVPNLLISVSEDQVAKIWDIDTKKASIDLVYSKNIKIVTTKRNVKNDFF
jgi:periodic tryptophan protein 1